MVICSEYMTEIICKIKTHKLLHFTPCVNNASFCPFIQDCMFGNSHFFFKKTYLLKVRHDFLPGKLTEGKKNGDGEDSFHLLLNDHSVMLLPKFPS